MAESNNCYIQCSIDFCPYIITNYDLDTIITDTPDWTEKNQHKIGPLVQSTVRGKSKNSGFAFKLFCCVSKWKKPTTHFEIATNPPTPVPEGIFTLPVDKSALESPFPLQPVQLSSCWFCFLTLDCPFQTLACLLRSLQSRSPARTARVCCWAFSPVDKPDPQTDHRCGLTGLSGNKAGEATGTITACGGNLHKVVNSIKRRQGWEWAAANDSISFWKTVRAE